MVPERDLDPTERYDAERRALVDLLLGCDGAALDHPVPATPAWRVRDVLAHVVGITADLNAQRFPATPADAEAWTAAQVATRRDATIAELGAEWEREAPTFTAGLRLFGYDWGAHYLGDLLQHVADVHAALGRDPARDDLALAVALDFYLASLDEDLAAAGLGPVTVLATGAAHPPLVAADERFVLGTTGPDGGVTVGGSRWALFRALGGRRTAAEVRALAWTGSATAVSTVAERFSRYPMQNRSLGEVPDGGHPEV